MSNLAILPVKHHQHRCFPATSQKSSIPAETGKDFLFPQNLQGLPLTNMYSTTCNINTIMHLKPNCELSSWPVSRCYAYIMPPCILVSKRLKELITCKDDVLSKPDVGLAAGCMFLVSLYLTDGGCKASIITNSTWKDFKCFYERTVVVCVCSLLVCYEMLLVIKLHPDEIWWCLGLKLSDKWLIKV